MMVGVKDTMKIGTDGFIVRPLPYTTDTTAVGASRRAEAELLPAEELLKDERLRRILSN